MPDASIDSPELIHSHGLQVRKGGLIDWLFAEIERLCVERRVQVVLCACPCCCGSFAVTATDLTTRATEDASEGSEECIVVEFGVLPANTPV